MRGTYVLAVAATLLSAWTACVGSDPAVVGPDNRGAAGQGCLADGTCLAGLACVQSTCVVSEAGAPSEAGTTTPPSDAGNGDECAALSRQGTM